MIENKKTPNLVLCCPPTPAGFGKRGCDRWQLEPFLHPAAVQQAVGRPSAQFTFEPPIGRHRKTALRALDYRRRWWGVTLDGDYADGVRQSGYHSARAGLRLRITP